MDPTKILTKLFGTSGRVLVKDGEFNEVEGRLEHHDFSEHTMNINYNNMVDNFLDNVCNSSHQDIYRGRSAPSNHRNHRSATGRAAPTNTSAMNNQALQATESAELVYSAITPQLQAPMQGGGHFVYNSSFTVGMKSPGQQAYTQPGDIRPMRPGELEFMRHQMASMSQEMNNEFGVENGDEDVSSEDETPAATRSHSLTTDFQHLTIDECVSPSARSHPVHVSSPNALMYEESPRHDIEGNIVEVDESYHEYNFHSHRVCNNIVENSFGERKEEVFEQIPKFRKSKQSHVPRRNKLNRHDGC